MGGQAPTHTRGPIDMRRPVGTLGGSPGARLLALALLCLCPTMVTTINVARVGNQLVNDVHYEYHIYRITGVRITAGEGLVGLDTRQPPVPGAAFSNLTIDSPEEDQVIRELVQPAWAWLPLVTGAGGQPQWLTYNETTGAIVETNATYVNTATPLPNGRLVVGGCMGNGGRWSQAGLSSTSAATIILKTATSERGTFRHGDSYYHIDKTRRSFLAAHPLAGEREFLSYPGKVVSIETAEENAFLASMLRDLGIKAAWIGAVRGGVVSPLYRTTWAWGTKSDGTRRTSVFADASCLGEPSFEVVFLPGFFHNFTDAAAACGTLQTGAMLHDDGSWSAAQTAFDRLPMITEFATSRNLSQEVAYRDKVFRIVALDEPYVAARATAERARYDLLPNVTLPGHLPVPDSFGEVLLLAQMAAATRPFLCTLAKGIRRRTRAFLGFDYSPSSFNFVAAYGPKKGLELGFVPNSTYSPVVLLNISPMNINPVGEQCAAAESMGYRFGQCGSALGVTIAEFNLNMIDGRFYTELGLVAGPHGLQQLVGSRLGALIAHAPILRTEAQLQVFNSSVARSGFGQGMVSSVSRVAGSRFRWPDGQLVGANLSSAPPLQLLVPRCLSVRPVEDPLQLWNARSCFKFWPVILELSRAPVTPVELNQLPVCEACECTPPSLRCFGAGLTLIPTVCNASLYTLLLSSGNQVSRLSRRTLQFPNLLEASVFANGIDVVDDDAFEDCPKLSVIDLSINALTQVPILNYLTALVELSLLENNIQSFRPGALPASLTSLALGSNVITAIPAGSFTGLSRLTLLSLNFNPVAAVHISAFVPVSQAGIFLDNTPCACAVSSGVLSQCPATCQVLGSTTAATTTPPIFQQPPTSPTPSGRGSSSSGAIIGAVVATLVIVALLVLLVLWRRGAAQSTKVQVDPRGAWSGDASSSALCAGDMSSFTVVEEETVTALMGARISQDSLELGQPLGKGAFGQVLRGRGRGGRIAGMAVAVKTLAPTAGSSARDVFMKEASLQLELRHPHIVTLLGVCMNPGRGPMIVMELMPRGDLHKYLVKETASGRAPETAALTSWCEQVCSAMAYLETKRILHRDIAARNVLLSGELVAKLADLGLARTLSGKDYYRKLSDDRVPIKWMAPESIVDKVYVIRSDVWSFGVLMFETFNLGGKPYPTMTAAETVKFVLGGNRLPAPDGMPEEIARMMHHCWQHEPYERPSFAELHAGLVSLTDSNEEESVL